MSDQADELDFLYDGTDDTDTKDVIEATDANSPKDNTDAPASDMEMADGNKDTENSSDDSDSNNDNDSDQDSDSDSDSDDDLQVILEHGSENGAGQTTSVNPTTASAGGADGQGDSAEDSGKTKSGDGGIQALFAGGVDRMDVLTVPLLQGVDMYTIDVDMLEEKPWRLPGADVTDYFNFGFSEETWKLYCMKQKEIRAYYNIHKMLPPGMMMMPGVAPGMPMGNPAMYPNMMNPAFRPGMPGNMYQPGTDSKDGNQNRGPNAPNPMQQQQQMRMGMPGPMNPGFYPGMAGAQRNMPMGNMPPQMQIGNRGPMPPNHGQQNINQRLSQNPSHRHGSGDHRDNDQASESGRSSRMGSRRERSTSVHQSRDRNEDHNESRSRRDHDRERDHDKDRGRDRDRDRERERDRERGRDSNRADRDRGGDTEAKRSERRGDRGRERDSKDKSSREGRDGRSSRGQDSVLSRIGGEKTERSTSKRRRSASRDKDALPKSSRRRH